jgi:hypothetical protein
MIHISEEKLNKLIEEIDNACLQSLLSALLELKQRRAQAVFTIPVGFTIDFSKLPPGSIIPIRKIGD